MQNGLNIQMSDLPDELQSHYDYYLLSNCMYLICVIVHITAALMSIYKELKTKLLKCAVQQKR